MCFWHLFLSQGQCIYIRVSFFCFRFFSVFSLCCTSLVVSNSAVDCVEELVSKMTRDVTDFQSVGFCRFSHIRITSLFSVRFGFDFCCGLIRCLVEIIQK